MVGVIVSYNSQEDAAVLASQLVDGGVDACIIVENGQVFRGVEEYSDKVVVLHGHGNCGYGGGLNAGIEYARRTGWHPEYAICANADLVIPAPGRFVRELIEPLRSGRSAASGPLVVESNGTLRLPYARPRTWRDVLLHRYPVVVGGDEDVHLVSGACFAVAVNAWDVVGGMDPAIHLYCDEDAFFYRLKSHRFRVMWVRSVCVYHVQGKYSGAEGLLAQKRQVRRGELQYLQGVLDTAWWKLYVYRAERWFELGLWRAIDAIVRVE